VLFNSAIYIFLFLPSVVVVFFMLNRLHKVVLAQFWLVLASLFFYGYWNPSYLALITISVLVNFLLGLGLQNCVRGLHVTESTRRYAGLLLWFGVALNLMLIGYFKYADFFITNIDVLSGAEFPLLHLLLPLAISFFTFQQIAYLVDSYQGKVEERNLLRYSLFVTFFPQLIAGPIVHHSEMMGQFKSLRTKVPNWKHIFIGCVIFSLGLFKKVAIADTFSTWADPGFAVVEAPGFFTAWGTSLSYYFQLYFDFSGYTDMAIGAALLMNIHLPGNFESPYKARGIREFWQCWHMTLSRWLKQYLYIPLGGNHGSSAKVLINLLLTFVLGGLWHGAAWTFVLWGLLHGIALLVQRVWQRSKFSMPGPVAWLLTFLFINFSWVVFRAQSLETTGMLWKAMLDVSSIHVQTAPYLSAWTFVAAALALLVVTPGTEHNADQNDVCWMAR